MAMHGFSGYSGSGGGGGSGPVDYMIDDHYYDKNEGIWQPRDPRPEVIEGDPRLMIQMIDSLHQRHRYTSGVLSFTTNDTETLKASGLDAAIIDITESLKDMLFAAIAPEYQHILIVAHTHLNRLELHYVLPRHNYEVNKAWNPAPPGQGKFRQMDALVDLINVKYGLDDPRDPLRSRVTQEIRWEPDEKKHTREMLNCFFSKAVIDGAIENRDELICLAKRSGFAITRTGEDYVSMRAPGAEKAIRLKGEIYNATFTSRAKLTDTKTKSREREAYLAAQQVAGRYKQAVRERQFFIESRFKKALSISRTGKGDPEAEVINHPAHKLQQEAPSNIDQLHCNKHINKYYNCDAKVINNDINGNEINRFVTSAIRVNGKSKHSFDTANRVIAAGVEVAKSATARLGVPAVGSPYGAPPSAPASTIGMGGLAISDVAGGIAAAETGDAESDRILITKRCEAVESAQRAAARARRDASRNQKLSDDCFDF
ncbi:hypothetical protein [Pseudomonas sp. zbq_11]|uniref:hypothetical protein n=1 Tax=unclassified Pseudomonas TaxID=196821 RepID=UPI00370B96B6